MTLKIVMQNIIQGGYAMLNQKTTNKLINEKSPYLLQHAHNPVDWYPWGPEAFSRAVAEDKPIFLSIGYSTCHWCHVMERESFEDKEVAQVLNRNFIAIKVDREERPDVDHIYMSVCQALTGQGGWPLTIFMTPDRIPFYAGTYFPKLDMMRMPGLMTVLDNVTEAWRKNRSGIVESGKRIIETMKADENVEAERLSESENEEAYLQLKNSFDNVFGGFGNAPKFPSPHNLYFLLRYWHKTGKENALQMVEKSLDAMYRGGMYDHIGFGFSRYSTDRKWLVPHFEKMLYDNALLAIAYLEAYQATRKKKYARIAREIFTYILRDMTSPEGGFYSAEDADSEGVEGKFYVWEKHEIENILDKEAAKMYCNEYHITENGNFEGKNIPNLIGADVQDIFDEVDENGEVGSFLNNCREKLFNYREKRVHPYKDDKILTAWNGLMIAALAIGGRVLGDANYITAAEKSVEFIYKHLVSKKDGRLLARYRDGDAALPAYADDYAFLTWGLIELYESTYKPEYLQNAIKTNSEMIKLFWDNSAGGFFIYGSDSEQLIMRPKDIYDGAIPSGNSVAALNLLRLARLTGDASLEEKAGMLLKAFSKSIKTYPRAYPFSLIALMYSLSQSQEVVIVTEKDNKEAGGMLELVNQSFRPFTSVIYLNQDNAGALKEVIPFINTYSSVNGQATAYVCRNQSCQAPVTDIEALKALL